MKKDCRRAWFFFWATLAALAALPFSLYSQDVYASSPQDIHLQYNLTTKILRVTITHDSMFKGSHYIKFVEIKKNASTVSINTYNAQPAGKTFTYAYKIPAIEDDTFVVDCSCNLSGRKTSPVLTVR